MALQLFQIMRLIHVKIWKVLWFLILLQEWENMYSKIAETWQMWLCPKKLQRY